ncbi:MAG: macro domain-containing protein [Candidatus Aminicenantales bacterium]
MIQGKKIRLVTGNIALLECEAIVNAANQSLILGGGVAGAIKKYGGSSIQEECHKLAPIEVGQAVATSGGNLKARYVIHAVGPVYGEGNEEDKLARATLSSLKIAKEKKIKNIAFPAISTGIFGFPINRCSEIMIHTAKNFLQTNDYPREILFCLYDDAALLVFETTLQKSGESNS